MNTLKKTLKILIPLAIGLVILYFLYAGTDFNRLWADIKEANWKILIFSLLFGLSGNVIRGIRWNLLIRPLGYQPQKFILIYAVLGSYAINFIIPRAGELWRCGMIAQKENIPFVKGVETLLLDRLADIIMVALISLIAFVCNTKVFYQNIQVFHLPGFLVSPCFYIGMLVLLIILVAIIIVLSTLFKEKSLVKTINNFFVSLRKDLSLLWQMKEKKRFVLYSFGIWTSYFLYFYITFYAFSFTADLGISAGLFLFALSSIGMAIPSNGGLGPWQAAVVIGLCAFNINVEYAKVFATAVFTLQSTWTVTCGLFSLVMLSAKKKTN